jgi:hypothetical protein
MRKRSRHHKPKPLFLAPLTALLILLALYALDIEVPVHLSASPSIGLSYRSLNATITLYKVYNSLDKGWKAHVEVAVRDRGSTNQSILLDFGLVDTGPESLTFVKRSASIMLSGNRDYLAFLVVNKSFTGVVIAPIDASYAKSFDSIVDYYPLQYHFIIRVQKCGISISFNSPDIRRATVKAIDEEGSVRLYEVVENTTINTCADYVDIDAYSSPLPLLTLKTARGSCYLVLGESPLLLLILVPTLLYLFVKSFRSYLRESKRFIGSRRRGLGG